MRSGCRLVPRPLAVVLTDASSALRRAVRAARARGALGARVDRLALEAAALTAAAALSEVPDVRAALDAARAESERLRQEASLAKTMACETPPVSRETLVWISDEHGVDHCVTMRE